MIKGLPWITGVLRDSPDPKHSKTQILSLRMKPICCTPLLLLSSLFSLLSSKSQEATADLLLLRLQLTEMERGRDRERRIRTGRRERERRIGTGTFLLRLPRQRPFFFVFTRPIDLRPPISSLESDQSIGAQKWKRRNPSPVPIVDCRIREKPFAGYRLQFQFREVVAGWLWQKFDAVLRSNSAAPPPQLGRSCVPGLHLGSDFSLIVSLILDCFDLALDLPVPKPYSREKEKPHKFSYFYWFFCWIKETFEIIDLENLSRCCFGFESFSVLIQS